MSQFRVTVIPLDTGLVAGTNARLFLEPKGRRRRVLINMGPIHRLISNAHA